MPPSFHLAREGVIGLGHGQLCIRPIALSRLEPQIFSSNSGECEGVCLLSVLTLFLLWAGFHLH